MSLGQPQPYDSGRIERQGTSWALFPHLLTAAEETASLALKCDSSALRPTSSLVRSGDTAGMFTTSTPGGSTPQWFPLHFAGSFDTAWTVGTVGNNSACVHSVPVDCTPGGCDGNCKVEDRSVHAVLPPATPPPLDCGGTLEEEAGGRARLAESECLKRQELQEAHATAVRLQEVASALRTHAGVASSLLTRLSAQESETAERELAYWTEMRLWKSVALAGLCRAEQRSRRVVADAEGELRRVFFLVHGLREGTPLSPLLPLRHSEFGNAARYQQRCTGCAAPAPLRRKSLSLRRPPPLDTSLLDSQISSFGRSSPSLQTPPSTDPPSLVHPKIPPSPEEDLKCGLAPDPATFRTPISMPRQCAGPCLVAAQAANHHPVPTPAAAETPQPSAYSPIRPVSDRKTRVNAEFVGRVVGEVLRVLRRDQYQYQYPAET
eukprot:Hpha_TRINITY_DN15432_c0_g1::TRINITY_DN15432_c0_g1_i1::g.174288::m.174288